MCMFYFYFFYVSFFCLFSLQKRDHDEAESLRGQCVSALSTNALKSTSPHRGIAPNPAAVGHPLPSGGGAATEERPVGVLKS